MGRDMQVCPVDEVVVVVQASIAPSLVFGMDAVRD